VSCGPKLILAISSPTISCRDCYQPLGKYDKAVEEAKKAIELNPDFAIGYNNLACSYELP
jgi:tetratricopeptide (TPR) repeat protein